jgi:hypothetical protein
MGNTLLRGGGADLARLETQIAVKTLYKRLPGLRVRSGFVSEQVPGMVFRTWCESEMVYDGPALPQGRNSEGAGIARPACSSR